MLDTPEQPASAMIIAPILTIGQIGWTKNISIKRRIVSTRSRLLEFLPDSFFDPLHSGNGSGYNEAWLELERVVDGMNKDKIRVMVGAILRLDPPVIHLDEDGNQLPLRDDVWRYAAYHSGLGRLELHHIGSGGYRCLLFADRIIEYQDDDLHYPPTTKQGLLVLKVQIIVKGDGLVEQQAIFRGSATR